MKHTRNAILILSSILLISGVSLILYAYIEAYGDDPDVVMQNRAERKKYKILYLKELKSKGISLSPSDKAIFDKQTKKEELIKEMLQLQQKTETIIDARSAIKETIKAATQHEKLLAERLLASTQLKKDLESKILLRQVQHQKYKNHIAKALKVLYASLNRFCFCFNLNQELFVEYISSFINDKTYSTINMFKSKSNALETIQISFEAYIYSKYISSMRWAVDNIDSIKIEEMITPSCQLLNRMKNENLINLDKTVFATDQEHTLFMLKDVDIVNFNF